MHQEGLGGAQVAAHGRLADLEHARRLLGGHAGEETQLDAGTIVATFDFVPEAGSHVYDLLVTDSGVALDDSVATFTVRGLNTGFAVDFFDVVDTGVDVVRLMISGAPADEIFVDGFESGNTTAWSALVP